MLEHMAHAGTMNGKLVCTYADFEKWGVWRRRLRLAIRDSVDRGLVVVTQKGRASAGEDRWPNKYALGWLPLHDGASPQNRWKTWTKKAPQRTFFPGGQTSTGNSRKTTNSLVDKRPPERVDKCPPAKARISVPTPSGQTSTTSNISGARRGRRKETREASEPAAILGEQLLTEHTSDERLIAIKNWGKNADKKISPVSAKNDWTKPSILSDEPRDLTDFPLEEGQSAA
jgi:hypothetical protein